MASLPTLSQVILIGENILPRMDSFYSVTKTDIRQLLKRSFDVFCAANLEILSTVSYKRQYKDSYKSLALDGFPNSTKASFVNVLIQTKNTNRFECFKQLHDGFFCVKKYLLKSNINESHPFAYTKSYITETALSQVKYNVIQLSIMQFSLG